MARKKSNIVCRGYGSPHGYAQGRHWFVCQQCRWYVGPPKALPTKFEEAQPK